MMRFPLKNIAADKDGMAAVEMAFVAMPLIIFMLGGMDLGRHAYAASVLQGTLVQAARKAGLEGASTATVRTFVDGQLSQFAKPANITLDIQNFRKFTGIGVPEKITTDTVPLGTYNLGDCYIDANNSNTYDAQQGSSGIGTAEDALKVRIGMDMPRLSPIGGLIGYSNTIRVERTTVIQAEPYAGVVDPPVRCT